VANPQPGSCTSSLGTGQVFTYAQLEGLWIKAGGPSSLAATMAAVAEAESSGCSVAYNSSGATGLWQILGAVDPADQAHLTDPAVNAKEAVAKYKSQGLKAWVTYTSGAYKAFMQNGTTPDTNVPGSSSAAAGAASGSCTPACLACISVPTIDLKVTSVGGQTLCLFTRTEARAWMGAILTMWGGGILVVSVAILAVTAFSKSGAAGAAGKAGGTVAEGAGAALALGGAPEVGAPVAALGGGLKGKGRSYANKKLAAKRKAAPVSRETEAAGAAA
jgi:Lysozyme like domain